MIRPILTFSVLLASLSTTALRAQDQATTLLQAVRSADVIVRATATAVTSPTPQLHRLQFHRDELLKGQVGTHFSMSEPAGQCCGRSLFAMQVGESRLLFLRRVGPTLHTFGGGRGVLPTTPAILAHVEALLGATTDAAATHVLAAQLDNTEPRIANDAALALASMPTLQLTATERQRVLTSLQSAVTRGSTRSAPLADVAARAGGTTTLDAMLPIYLHAARDDQAKLLASALRRCSSTQVANRLPMFVNSDRRSNLRAAQLLTQLPAGHAQRAMTTLLQQANHPQIKLHLCEGLLCAGVNSASLQSLVPAPVLQLAQQRIARRRTFRNITPNRR